MTTPPLTPPLTPPFAPQARQHSPILRAGVIAATALLGLTAATTALASTPADTATALPEQEQSAPTTVPATTTTTTTTTLPKTTTTPTTTTPTTPATTTPATTTPASTAPPTPAGSTPKTAGATTIPAQATIPTTSATTIPTRTPATVVVPTSAPAPVIVPAPRSITVYPNEIGNVMATIRYMESRGQYAISPNKGNASGAYQFIGSTWDNYAGYAHAYLAPPHIQDERAALDVVRFLKQWNNDVSMIPVMWYYPRASREPALMDVVPVPSAGNVLTIREYQTRWLNIFATISGQPAPQALSLADAVGRLGAAPTLEQRDDGVLNITYPVLGPARLAVPDCDAADGDTQEQADAAISRADIEAAGLCTEQAPSIIFGVKLQPIRAAATGVVTAVDDEPGSDRPIAVTITDADGVSFIYAGFNDDNQGTADGNAPDHLRLTDLARVGTTVRAGQIIGFMGDTDPLPTGVRADVPTDASVVIDPDAVAPHLRLSIIDIDGNPIEAFGPVVDALFSTTCQAGIGQWSVPAQDTTTKPVTVETTDNSRDVDSEWIITSTGQVQADGWGALINPHDGCTWVPAEPYGPGAGGSSQIPVDWADDVDLPAEIWVSLALAQDDSAPATLIRF